MSKLILLSGWANPGESMGELSNKLADLFDVHTVSVHELPGFNTLNKNFKYRRECSGTKSPIPSDYALGLISLIKKINYPCILIGWSTGGLAALEATSYCPDVIRGLVLIGTTAKFCVDENYQFGRPLQWVRAMAQGLRRDAKNVLAEFFKAASSPFAEDSGLLEAKVKAALSLGVDTLLDGLKYIQHADLRDPLRSMGVPSLVLHGEKDAIIPWQAGQYLSGMIRNSTWVMHHGAGHDLPIRYPQIMADYVQGFVKDKMDNLLK